MNIKNKKGEVIHTIEAENLYGANLSGANLYGANLRSADLSGANLSDVDQQQTNHQPCRPPRHHVTPAAPAHSSHGLTIWPY